MNEADRSWMLRALGLADTALGDSSPDPPVGAVIVRGDQILGEGRTLPAGGDHAEVVALDRCRIQGHEPRGATLYTTLEPCCHRDRTSPCTDAILSAGLRRVVIGVEDPLPAMRGRSISLLRERGIEVILGIEEEACARRILGFARAIVHGLPEVTLKAAISADGRIATAGGESRWITSPRSREAGHRLRAAHDAILVGIGTVLADDPRLTTRLPEGGRDPVPVVLDTSLRIPVDAQLFGSPRRPVILCGEDAPDRRLPAEVVRIPRDVGGLDPVAALRELASRGLHRILVEGGGQIHRTMLDRGLVDTVELFVAPMLIPGGRPWVGGQPIPTLGSAVRMELQRAEAIGPDARLVFRLAHGLAPDPLATLRASPR